MAAVKHVALSIGIGLSRLYGSDLTMISLSHVPL